MEPVQTHRGAVNKISIAFCLIGYIFWYSQIPLLQGKQRKLVSCPASNLFNSD